MWLEWCLRTWTLWSTFPLSILLILKSAIVWKISHKMKRCNCRILPIKFRSEKNSSRSCRVKCNSWKVQLNKFALLMILSKCSRMSRSKLIRVHSSSLSIRIHRRFTSIFCSKPMRIVVVLYVQMAWILKVLML